MKHVAWLSLTLLLAAPFATAAEQQHEPEMVRAPQHPKLEDIKQLTGTWSGTHKGHGETGATTVTYEVVSGGTAVVEKLWPGTPQEMVSVYHSDGDQLLLTHYCSLGNQPTMALKNHKKGMMNFEFVRGANMKSENDMHIHALKLTWRGKNEIQHEWIGYKDGKPLDTTVLQLKRVKGAE